LRNVDGLDLGCDHWIQHRRQGENQDRFYAGGNHRAAEKWSEEHNSGQSRADRQDGSKYLNEGDVYHFRIARKLDNMVKE